jgi:polyferredoxin
MKLFLRRRLVQAFATVASNAYLPGFIRGKLYTGPGKLLCLPGLNCYSCPGAVGACPLGSLQNALSSYEKKWPLYVGGLLLLYGLIMGRWICGWLCPFGFFQELIHKIPHKKVRVPKKLAFFKYLKYIFLAVLVIAMPLLISNKYGMGAPWFCKLVCPAGTLGAALPLMAVDAGLRSQAGTLFALKITVALIVVVGCVFIFRFFCRFMCPLGALYGLFNRIAMYHFDFLPDRCTRCGACSRACPVDIEPHKSPNSTECIRCGACLARCPHGALEARFGFKEGKPNPRRAPEKP